MKRCAIFFALLIATLLIAIWSEHRQGMVSGNNVAMGTHVTAARQNVTVPFSE